MSDRFKFRVWDTDIKEYLVGEFLVGGCGDMIHNVVDYESFLNKGNYIIEQCTGLKDKNGKLIHDGDVVIKRDINALGYGRIRKCFVHYNNKWAAWAITTQYHDTYPLSEFEPEAYEIIGTIHDTNIENDD